MPGLAVWNRAFFPAIVLQIIAVIMALEAVSRLIHPLPVNSVKPLQLENMEALTI